MSPSLEVLNLSGNIITPHKFTSGIPTEWSALTNLKELNMQYCGLHGASCAVFPVTPAKNSVETLRSEFIKPEKSVRP